MRRICFRVFFLLLIVFGPNATRAFDGFSEKDEKFIAFASQGNVAELKKIRGLHPWAMAKSLNRAVSPCFANTVSHLLGRGYTFPQDDLGHALHFASQEGEAECVALLLNIGAPVNFVYDDKTPLKRAKERRHLVVVDLLKLRGAQLDKLQPLVTFSARTVAIALAIPLAIWLAGIVIYKLRAQSPQQMVVPMPVSVPPAEGSSLERS